MMSTMRYNAFTPKENPLGTGALIQQRPATLPLQRK